MRAVVSIGTNTTRLLIARKEGSGFATLAHDAIGTRLGEGLRESGHLSDAAMRRTLDAVRRLSFEARRHTTEVHAIATSAMRRADNAAEFSDAVRNISGAQLHVLMGDEEARYSFVGAIAQHPPQSPNARVGVLDVGGGSTEYGLGTAAGPERVVSCEIGAVRLTEEEHDLNGLTGRAPRIDRARSIARERLQPLEVLRGAHSMFAVGGTATTAAAVVRGGNRDAADGTLLDRGRLGELIDRFATMRLSARKQIPGLEPQRADIFPAGLIVIDEALAALEMRDAVVSTGDLLLGYLSAN